MQISFMTQNLKTLFRITWKQTMKGRIKLPKPQRILSGNQNSEKARQVAAMAGEITVYRDTLSLIAQNFEEPAAAVLLQGLIKRSERTIKTITKFYNTENPDLLKIARSHHLLREEMIQSLEKHKNYEFTEAIAQLDELIKQADKWLESTSGARRAQVAQALLKMRRLGNQGD